MYVPYVTENSFGAESLGMEVKHEKRISVRTMTSNVPLLGL